MRDPESRRNEASTLESRILQMTRRSCPSFRYRQGTCPAVEYCYVYICICNYILIDVSILEYVLENK